MILPITLSAMGVALAPVSAGSRPCAPMEPGKLKAGVEAVLSARTDSEASWALAS
jgi:hypothetical protein